MSTGNTGKEKLTEAMSALMDNEASEFEFRRILKECESNETLKNKWERFHLLSSLMKGELGNMSIANETERNSELKRPDLLSRINAELDGKSDSKTHASAADKNQEAVANQSHSFGRLGQGAIAASVALVVLITGGMFSPFAAQEAEFADLQLADQAGIAEENELQFDDAYSPSQFSRIPQLSTELAGTETLDDEVARDRLRQAVFQEFVGEPQESIELPVNFNVIIEEE